MSGGRLEERVFRDALAAISVDAMPPGAPTDITQAPKDAAGELEVLIDDDDTLEAVFLHRGVEASRSIAKLHVHRHFGGAPSLQPGDDPDLFLGTGWMIAPRLMITNHHVVAARAKEESPPSAADFDLQGAATGVLFDYFASGDLEPVRASAAREGEKGEQRAPRSPGSRRPRGDN